MDDQFNGRTDDALFADEFEPVNDAVPESKPKTDTTSIPVPPVETQPAPVAPSTEPSQPTPAVTNAPLGLASSRHAGPAQRQQRPRKSSFSKSATPSTNASSAPSDPSSSSASTPTAKPRPGSNTALPNRIASGANPRTKLSDTELAEKMQKMRILSAEKARKFEQAERDSLSHALAYEKGMEEEKRRHAEAAEVRRKGEEQRRQMDQERAANRERKLKAMGAKEGAWDEGKQAEGENERQGFRGANGGIRGARNMYNPDREASAMEFAPDEFRGRGRGRGRGGFRGGRGGRGGFAERNAGNGPSHYQYRHQDQQQQHPQEQQQHAPHQQTQQQQQPKQQQQTKPEQGPPTAEDFPALPSSKAKPEATTPTTTTTPAKLDDLLPYSLAASSGEKIAWDEY